MEQYYKMYENTTNNATLRWKFFLETFETFESQLLKCRPQMLNQQKGLKEERFLIKFIIWKKNWRKVKNELWWSDGALEGPNAECIRSKLAFQLELQRASNDGLLNIWP